MIEILLGTAVLSYFVYWWCWSTQRPIKLEGRHVLITGGSSGIGLALAMEAVRRHARRLTLVARDAAKLADAKNKLTAFDNACDIQTVSLDVSESYEKVKTSLSNISEVDRVDVLINCAGMSVARTFEDSPPESFETQIRINYLGSVYVTKALLPSMLSEADIGAKSRRIAFVSSLAQLISIYGFSGYAASKAAVGAFANVLQQELESNGPAVTIVFPPDTNTPGFELENIGKPTITAAISDAGGLFSPEEVAIKAMGDILLGKRRSLIGLTGHILSWSCAGVSRPHEDLFLPIPPALSGILEVLFAPFFKIALIGFAYWSRFRILIHSRPQ